jgi:cytochrome c oxidase assembly protein Cox11
LNTEEVQEVTLSYTLYRSLDELIDQTETASAPDALAQPGA